MPSEVAGLHRSSGLVSFARGMPTQPSNLDQLCELIRAHHPCIYIPTFEEDYALQLVRDAAIRLGRGAWCWSIIKGVSDTLLSNAPVESATENPVIGLARMAQIAEMKDSAAGMGGSNGPVLAALDLAPHLSDDRTLRLLRETIPRLQRHGATLVLIDHRSDLPPAVMADATRLDLSFPTRDELHDIVKATLQWAHRGKPVRVNLSKRDLETFLRNLAGLTRRQARQVVLDAIAEDRTFDAKDLHNILSLKRQAVTAGGLLEYVKSPVDLSSIGGMKNLKQWLADREQAFEPEAAAKGLVPPRGVLMLGVQGAGKSLCAKAIATAWQRPLLRMDVGGLYDRYIGESERRLRDALRQAEAMAPIVLWIDEIEKAFAGAASTSTDGGLSRRMFGALLTWMQEHRAPVFLVATANDIEALPPELLRKGRFDEIFFVDLPAEEARDQIIRIHLLQRNQDPKMFDVPRIVAATHGYSGAEIEQAIIASLYKAAAKGDALTTDMVVDAAKNSPPLSVTMRERVDELRRWAKGRCVPAD